jgi:hypothetical protein
MNSPYQVTLPLLTSLLYRRHIRQTAEELLHLARKAWASKPRRRMTPRYSRTATLDWVSTRRGTNNTAVIAQSNTGRGVDARSAQFVAIEATATNDTAVFAHSGAGRGVDARSAQVIALEATATNDTAVFAHSNTGRGVDGRSNTNEGVHESSSSAPAVVGFNTAPSSPNGDGVFGVCAFQEGGGNAIHGQGGNNAGFFEGDVTVKAFGISAGDSPLMVQYPLRRNHS